MFDMLMCYQVSWFRHMHANDVRSRTDPRNSWSTSVIGSQPYPEAETSLFRNFPWDEVDLRLQGKACFVLFVNAFILFFLSLLFWWFLTDAVISYHVC